MCRFVSGSIPTPYRFLSILLYNTACGQGWWFPQKFFYCWEQFSLTWVFCYSKWIWELFFLTLWRTELEFWWRLHWIYRLLWARWPFYYINPANPWAWKIFPSSEIFFDFFLKNFWSSYHTDLSLPQSHQGILYYLWLLWRVSFPNFFLGLFILCLEEGHRFVWVNFITSHFAEDVFQV